MRIVRPATHIVLDEAEQRELLFRMNARYSPTSVCARKSSSLVPCGQPGTATAQRLGVGVHTVSHWRTRFSHWRLEGIINDELRPGWPRTITDQQIKSVVHQMLQTKPQDASYWSTWRMRQATGLSPVRNAHLAETAPGKNFKL